MVQFPSRALFAFANFQALRCSSRFCPRFALAVHEFPQGFRKVFNQCPQGSGPISEPCPFSAKPLHSMPCLIPEPRFLSRPAAIPYFLCLWRLMHASPSVVLFLRMPAAIPFVSCLWGPLHGIPETCLLREACSNSLCFVSLRASAWHP